ncbi:MAG: hypothetical protein AAFO68_10715 [Pseudomonadota bacterium]
MKRLFLVVGLVAMSGCVAVDPYGGGYGGPNEAALPAHPDPLCFYTEPFEPGGPLGEVCA